MGLIVLYKNEDWSMKSSTNASEIRKVVDRFRKIARSHGSSATWLPEVGYLVTDDNAEAPKDFPYETWLDQALQETGHLP